MSRERVSLLVIQRQLGHADLAIASAGICAGSTTPRSSTPFTSGPRR
jgi:hypothetical protein